jgi:hypothetical protein
LASNFLQIRPILSMRLKFRLVVVALLVERVMRGAEHQHDISWEFCGCGGGEGGFFTNRGKFFR